MSRRCSRSRRTARASRRSAIRRSRATSPLWDGGVEAGDPAFLTANGYVHVIADCRGVNRSEGDYRGWMSKQEAEDGYDLVEWIAAQPWCDGNVGMVGVSYFGTIQLHVAAEQPPHLKAIMPWNAVGGLLPRGDAPRRHHADLLLRALHALDARQPGLGDGRGARAGASSTRLLEERKADPDLRMYTTLWNVLDNPVTNPAFFDVLMHPLDGPFYWERSAYRARTTGSAFPSTPARPGGPTRTCT